jgi:hypothetical protein
MIVSHEAKTAAGTFIASMEDLLTREAVLV